MLPSWPEESSLFDGIAKVMRSKPGAVVDYLWIITIRRNADPKDGERPNAEGTV